MNGLGFGFGWVDSEWYMFETYGGMMWNREFIHFMDVPQLPILGFKVEKVFETKGKKLGSKTWAARCGWSQLLNCSMYCIHKFLKQEPKFGTPI